jgi:hypothetical protein
MTSSITSLHCNFTHEGASRCTLHRTTQCQRTSHSRMLQASQLGSFGVLADPSKVPLCPSKHLLALAAFFLRMAETGSLPYWPPTLPYHCPNAPMTKSSDTALFTEETDGISAKQPWMLAETHQKTTENTSPAPNFRSRESTHFDQNTVRSTTFRMTSFTGHPNEPSQCPTYIHTYIQITEIRIIIFSWVYIQRSNR